MLASGIVCWVLLEAIVNIAVMVGLLPFAGNALPFISYGGSNLVMTLAAMGVLLSVSRRDKSDENIPRRTRANGPAWSWTQRLGDAIKPNATPNLGRRNGRRRVSRSVRREDSH